MVDVVQTSLLHLENLANVIQKQMLMRKVLAVLHWDGVEIVQLTVIVQHVLITLQVIGSTNSPHKYCVSCLFRGMSRKGRTSGFNATFVFIYSMKMPGFTAPNH